MAPGETSGEPDGDGGFPVSRRTAGLGIGVLLVGGAGVAANELLSGNPGSTGGGQGGSSGMGGVEETEAVGTPEYTDTPAQEGFDYRQFFTVEHEVDQQYRIHLENPEEFYGNVGRRSISWVDENRPDNVLREVGAPAVFVPGIHQSNRLPLVADREAVEEGFRPHDIEGVQYQTEEGADHEWKELDELSLSDMDEFGDTGLFAGGWDLNEYLPEDPYFFGIRLNDPATAELNYIVAHL